jgi:hypothetical protein
MLNSNNGTPINSVLILELLCYNNNNRITSKDTTGIALFHKELKYLYDYGVRVITMSDLGYDENSKYLYVKNNNNEKIKRKDSNSRGDLIA